MTLDRIERAHNLETLVPVDDSGLLNWTMILTQGTRNLQVAAAEEQATICLQMYGTLPIEEILRHRESGGQAIIEAMDYLAKGGRVAALGQYRLHCDKTKEGGKPAPGYKWEHELGWKSEYRNEFGEVRKMTTRMRAKLAKISLRKGDRYDPYLVDTYTLDNDCCITVDWFTAMELMCSWSRWSAVPYGKERWCWSQVLPPIERENKPAPLAKGR